MVRTAPDVDVEQARAAIERALPRVTALSTAGAVAEAENRLSYFRQLAFILGAVSLVVGFLLVTTIVTVSVNERIGEIAVMRAIGVSRGAHRSADRARRRGAEPDWRRGGSRARSRHRALSQLDPERVPRAARRHRLLPVSAERGVPRAGPARRLGDRRRGLPVVARRVACRSRRHCARRPSGDDATARRRRATCTATTPTRVPPCTRFEACRSTSCGGEYVAIVGPSGCGKSTMLNLLGAIDRPTRGSVTIGGTAVSALPDRDATRFRLTSIGFVFQRFYLLPVSDGTGERRAPDG